MIISQIVAIDSNRGMGFKNQLPWHLPDDFKYFKAITQGHCMLMGRKTFESLGKPLPNRINIVITRDIAFHSEGTVIFNSIEEGIALAKSKNETELFIIGGANIFEQVMPISDKLYITKIHGSFKADVFYPEVDKSNFSLIKSTPHFIDEKHAVDFDFQVWERVLG